MYQPDSGSIRIADEEVEITSPSMRLKRGIGTVYQHFTAGAEPLHPGERGARRRHRLRAQPGRDRRAAGRRCWPSSAWTVSPQTEIRHLGLGQRQRVEIIKALLRGPRVLLLDEPTSVLTPGEVDSLLDLLRRLRGQGWRWCLITHKLGEALAVSDRVSVLRAGRNAGDLGPDALRGATRKRAPAHRGADVWRL